MSLRIDFCQLQLPASLGLRRFHIAQLLRAELERFDWPAGKWTALQVPPLTVVPQQSDLRIAHQIAEQIHRAAIRRSRLGAAS